MNANSCDGVPLIPVTLEVYLQVLKITEIGIQVLYSISFWIKNEANEEDDL